MDFSGTLARDSSPPAWRPTRTSRRAAARASPTRAWASPLTWDSRDVPVNAVAGRAALGAVAGLRLVSSAAAPGGSRSRSTTGTTVTLFREGSTLSWQFKHRATLGRGAVERSLAAGHAVGSARLPLGPLPRRERHLRAGRVPLHVALPQGVALSRLGVAALAGRGGDGLGLLARPHPAAALGGPGPAGARCRIASPCASTSEWAATRMRSTSSSWRPSEASSSADEGAGAAAAAGRRLAAPGPRGRHALGAERSGACVHLAAQRPDVILHGGDIGDLVGARAARQPSPRCTRCEATSTCARRTCPTCSRWS